MSLFGGNEKINVIAEVQAKPGSEDAVRAVMISLVAPALKEKGCKLYHLHEDTKQPGSFVTYEEWASEEALQTHLEKTKPILAQVQPLLAGELKLRVLKVLA